MARPGKVLHGLLALLLLLPAILRPAWAGNETFAAGSYVIDMGLLPQTVANALKPYGLVQALAVDNSIPVSWVINPSKLKDGVDFSHNSKDYRAGPFVISEGFAAQAAPVIQDWINNRGLDPAVVNLTVSPLTLPVHETITLFPRAVLDSDNGDIANEYLVNAGVDPSFYRIDTPAGLTSCDDVYTMPHADPLWSTHQNLVSFNQQGGLIWAACHAVSVLENVDDPGDGDSDPDMNFLSDGGLVDFGSHGDGSPPYSYARASDPIMQFLGVIDAATQNGSEQVYLPLDGSSWRSTTTIGSWDPDHAEVGASPLSPGEAAIIAYGPGFGVSTNGMVMYEAGHSHNKDSSGASIAAQRAYLNFTLVTGIMRRPQILASVPPLAEPLEFVNLNATVTGGSGGPYNYSWSSNCGGSFDNPAVPNPVFTTPPAIEDTTCLLTVTISDACTHNSFSVEPLLILGKPDLAITKSDSQDPATAGGTLVYTLDVVNNGSEATAVTVTDTLDTQTGFVSAVPSIGSCSESNGTVSCDLGTMATDATAAIVITVNTPSTPMSLSNTASVSTSDDDYDLSNNSATETTLVRPGIDLALAKSVLPATVGTNDTAIYTLVATNKDTQIDATNVVITDVLPAGTDFISAGGNGWSCAYNAADRTLTCDLAVLGAGSSSQLEVTVTATSSGSWLNSADISSSDFSDTDISDNTGSVSLLVVEAADLSIIKTADKLDAGDKDKPVFYLDVTNSGTDSADNVVVTDTLTFSNNKNNAIGYKDFYSFTKYYFTFPDGTRIQGGSTQRQVSHNGMSISVDYSPATSAAVDSNTPAPLPADGSPVTITWTVSPGLEPGDTLRLEFEAKKVGDTQSPNSATVSSDTDDPDLANNSDTILVGKKTPGGTTVKHADLEVRKAAAQNPQASDDPLNIISQADASSGYSYVISVLNNGPKDIPKGSAGNGYSTISVIDTLPVGMSYLGYRVPGTGVAHVLPGGSLAAANSVSKGSWSCSFNAPTRELDCMYTLDQGDDFDKETYSADLFIDVTAPVTPGIVTNTADQLSFNVPPAVSNDSWTDPYDYNDTASRDVDILPLQVDLAVAKSVDNAAPAAIGETVTYTVTVSNTSPGYADNASAVVIHDPLPAGLTLLSRTLSQGSYSGENWLAGDLDHGSSATMTTTVRVDATGMITNTATLSGLDQEDVNSANNAQSVSIEISGVSVSGRVWSDSNHDAVENGSEAGIAGVTVVLFNTSAGTCESTQTDGSGNYSFSGVADGAYQVVEAATESVPAPAVCPPTEEDPAGYLSTTPDSHPVSVAGAAVANLDFGDFHGSRYSGRVFEDNGSGSGIAHDAIVAGNESGLSGVIVQAFDSGLLDSVTTDADGMFSLWLPDAASGTSVDIIAGVPGSYLSVSKADGGAGDSAPAAAYNLLRVVPVSGQSFGGIAFGEVLEPAFAPDHSRSASPGSTLFFPHTYTAHTSGSVSFSIAGQVATPNVPGWNAILHDDDDCSGTLDAGENVHGAAITLQADTGSQACLVVQVFVPSSAPANAQYVVTLDAVFSYYANGLTTTRVRTDLTTTADSNLVLVKLVDKQTAQPGELLTYTITFTNAGSDALSTIVIDDATPGFTTFSNASCVYPLPASLSGCTLSVQPAVGETGAVQWSFNPGDVLQSGASGQVQYQVIVDN